MSDELRDALQRASAAGEPAVGDAFARFAVVKRRAAIARGSTVAAVGLIAAATLLFTLPGLNSGDAGGALTGGDVSPRPQYRAVKHYEDRIAGFSFDYPAEWTIDSVPGRYVRVRPAGPSDRVRVERLPCDGCPTYELITPGTDHLEIVGQADRRFSEIDIALLRRIGAELADAPSRSVAGVRLEGTRIRYVGRPEVPEPRSGDEMLDAPWIADATVDVYSLDAFGLSAFQLRRLSRASGDAAAGPGFEIVLRTLRRI